MLTIPYSLKQFKHDRYNLSFGRTALLNVATEKHFQYCLCFKDHLGFSISFKIDF